MQIRSKSRRFFVPLLAAAVPLVFFLSVELILRLIGFGFPTDFFLESRPSDRTVFLENYQFGLRFFPPQLNRPPLPLMLDAEKKDTFRIFVLGGSAALGDPEPAYGMPRVLEVLLKERFPHLKFEVINAAMTAINSHVVLPIARDCADKHADLWVIYMGNNEVVGPFGTGTIFSAQAPPISIIRTGLALKATRLGQGLNTLIHRISSPPKKPQPQAWQGMEMFLNRQLRHDHPGVSQVYKHFKKNLNDILLTAQKYGIPAIVCTVGVNLKDSPPFASLHRADLPVSMLSLWQTLYHKGVDLQKQGKFREALNTFLKAIDIDDQYAELHFRLAMCQEKLNDIQAACDSYAKARDLDTLRFRADSTINSIIRKTVAKQAAQNAYLTDTAKIFTSYDSVSIPGKDMFDDHVHLNFHGNYVLALHLARQAANILITQPPPGVSSGWLSEAECIQRLAYTVWNQYAILDSMKARYLQPPFTQQFDHAERIQTFDNKIAHILPRIRPEPLQHCVDMYSSALELRPEDHVLHTNLARLMTRQGDIQGALQHWNEVKRLIPHDENTYFEIGNLISRYYPSQIAQAEQYFLLALSYRPDFSEAANNLGLALSRQGKLEKAIEAYEKALRLKPDYADAYNNLGLAMVGMDRTDDALGYYKQALRSDPGYAFAHLNIGNLFVGQNRTADALDHYEAAIKIKPDFPGAYVNMAIACFKLQRMQEAERYAREALRLDPENKKAQMLLHNIQSR